MDRRTVLLCAAALSTAADAPTAPSPKAIVLAFSKMAFEDYRPKEAALQYLAPDFIEHNPAVTGTRASVIERLDKLDWSRGGPKSAIKRVIAEGDLVVVHHHLVRKPGTPGIAAVEIFRVEGGLIREHWDVLQPVPVHIRNRYGMF